MIRSSIENINIPMVYPKRGKGHVDVIVSFFVSVENANDVLEMSDIIYKFAGSQCSIETLKDVLKSFGSCDVKRLEARFTLMMCRTSTKDSMSYFPLECLFEYDTYMEKKTFVGIITPIKIEESPGCASKIKIMLDAQKVKSYEDLLDLIQKLTKFDIFPRATLWNDKEPDQVSLNAVFSNIKKYFRKKRIKTKGYIEFTGSDILNSRMYSIKTTF